MTRDTLTFSVNGQPLALYHCLDCHQEIAKDWWHPCVGGTGICTRCTV